MYGAVIIFKIVDEWNDFDALILKNQSNAGKNITITEYVYRTLNV